MKHLLVLAAVLIVAAEYANAESANACVIDPDAKPDDPVGESELIVAGRLTGWKAQYPPGYEQAAFAEIGVDFNLTVDKVFKGESRPELVFHRPAALQYLGDYEGRPPDEPRFEWGYETDCGPVGFQSDPTGKYLVVGLKESPGSMYRTTSAGSLVTRAVFFEGSGSQGAGYDNAVHRVTSHDFPSLDHNLPLIPVMAAAVLGPLAFLAGAAFLWRRGEPHNG